MIEQIATETERSYHRYRLHSRTPVILHYLIDQGQQLSRTGT